MNPVLITMLWYIIFIHSRFGGLSYRNTGNKNVQKCFAALLQNKLKTYEYKLWKSYIIGTGGIGVRAGGARGAAAPQILGNSNFLSSERKFGQSQFFKMFP